MTYAPPYSSWYPQPPLPPPQPLQPPLQPLPPQTQTPILYPQIPTTTTTTPQPQIPTQTLYQQPPLPLQPSQQHPLTSTTVEPETIRQFQAVDRLNRGKIGVPELNTALSASGMRFSYATTERLLRMYDVDYDGEIFVNEFQMVLEYIRYMGAAFRRRDTSGDGRLSGDEVRVALKESGYHLNDSTFQVMMRKFDRSKRGSLGFDDYIEISIFLSNVSNAFNENVRTDGNVIFDFDKFIVVSVSLL
ncbi:programmed cell death 6 protein-like protein [Trypanosoma theileri]|uniref:Programmed cell death 6 protein-like protein n=1 Tax=Trypanosoma theileri TaxID=67003 RepID=A0A1X0NJH7_9TRYP|nr:programmed cell death 6 protein-like protein [Trypanosoma theileri]ORC84895.1 programmed cell death 6 protein-like protein [Trypanosoma theileri]